MFSECEIAIQEPDSALLLSLGRLSDLSALARGDQGARHQRRRRRADHLVRGHSRGTATGRAAAACALPQHVLQHAERDQLRAGPRPGRDRRADHLSDARAAPTGGHRQAFRWPKGTSAGCDGTGPKVEGEWPGTRCPHIGPGDGRPVRPAPTRIERSVLGCAIRRRRATSASTTPAATEALSDSTVRAIGIDTVTSQTVRVSRASPRPSEPTTITSGDVASSNVVGVGGAVGVQAGDHQPLRGVVLERADQVGAAGHPDPGRGAGRGPPGRRRHRRRCGARAPPRRARRTRPPTGRSRRGCAGRSPRRPRRSAAARPESLARASRSSGWAYW